MFKKLLKVFKSLRGGASQRRSLVSTRDKFRNLSVQRFRLLRQPKGFLAMTVGVLGLMIIAGCATQSADFVIKEQTLKPFSVNDEGVQYQYSAPWDKNLFDGFYLTRRSTDSIGTEAVDVTGAIVPHHLTAGHIPATLFDYLKKQNPSTIVIVGPNHFCRGNSNIITSDRDWKPPFGQVVANHNTIREIRALKSVVVDEVVMKEEHSIYSLISFISKSLPNTQIIPLILKNNIKTSEMDELVATLEKELPKDAVIISSIDFSHYQPAPVAAFHDELSKSVIKNFDFSRLSKLEIDSTPSLYVLLKLMEKFRAQKPVYEMYDNPGQTSHYSIWFGDGGKCHPELVSGSLQSQTVDGEMLKQVQHDTGCDNTASILFFGDMMLDRNVAVRIKEHGADWLFSALAGEENRFFYGMDDIHVNLEGPFMDSCPPRGSMSFCFDAKLIPTLKKYNFSIFSRANNHALNMGKRGFDETDQNLSSADLSFYSDPYGVGILIREIGGLKIGFVSSNEVNNLINQHGLALTLQALKSETDFIVVNVHWGEEYKFLKSNASQQKLARSMIDAGADIIIGHHPHVVQEMEIYKNKPIFYSLGNFIFDQYFSPQTQQGLAVGLVLSKGGGQSVYVFPLQSVQSHVKLMSGETLNAFFTQFTDKSRLNGYNFENFNLLLSPNGATDSSQGL